MFDSCVEVSQERVTPAEARSSGSASHRVLAVVRDLEESVLVRAAFHLVGLDVREVGSIEEAIAAALVDPPVLIVIPVGAGGDGETTADEVDVPVVQFPSSADFGPLQLLGAAHAAAPDLYERLGSGVELPSAEERLVLLTHDLRRAVHAERVRRAERDEAWLATALGLIEALALRDIETAEHSQRVRRYARELTLWVEPGVLDDPTVELGFLLHDVGKLGLPDKILLKPGALTDAERARMQAHTLLGAQIAGGILPAGGQAAAVVRSHHEQWNGKGYPDGLHGEQIPLAARIFAVADALDALSSNRPYRSATTWENAVDRVRAASGTRFDPRVVEALGDGHLLRAVTVRAADA